MPICDQAARGVACRDGFAVVMNLMDSTTLGRTDACCRLIATAVVAAYYAIRPAAVSAQLALATGLSLCFFALVWRAGVLS